MNGASDHNSGPGLNGARSTPVLSSQESRTLELYDKLLQLQIKISYLRYQQQLSEDSSEPLANLSEAQDRLLHFQAAHSLRTAVVNNIVATPSVLAAVHKPDQGTPLARDIFEQIQDRDEVSLELAKQSCELRRCTDRLAQVEVDNILVSQRNKQLASRVLDLVSQAGWGAERTSDAPAFRSERVSLKQNFVTSRQKWRIMKGTTSAIVMGSGVDWASNEALRDIVLDQSELA